MEGAAGGVGVPAARGAVRVEALRGDHALRASRPLCLPLDGRGGGGMGLCSGQWCAGLGWGGVAVYASVAAIVANIGGLPLTHSDSDERPSLVELAVSNGGNVVQRA